MSIKVTDVGRGVKIEAQLIGGPSDQIGGLIGLHFRLNGVASESVSIRDVSSNDALPTPPLIDYSTTSNAMNPFTFNMNFFVIGDNRIGNDVWDIQTITFTVRGGGVLQAANFTAAGARLTSVGQAGYAQRKPQIHGHRAGHS